MDRTQTDMQRNGDRGDSTMKKGMVFVVAVLLMVVCTGTAASAADLTVRMDGVTVRTDVAPQLVQNRTMVPLRVLGETMGAEVDWADGRVRLTKGDLEIVLRPGSRTVLINGKQSVLDAAPYLYKGRMMVPLRFIGEAFDCTVHFQDRVVSVRTPPLVIDGQTVASVHREYRMTMGGVIQEMRGHGYHQALWNVIRAQTGARAEEPVFYSWMVHIDLPGAYYKQSRVEFLDAEGNSIRQMDLYGLVRTHQPEDLAGFPPSLVHDVTAGLWYRMGEQALSEVNRLIGSADRNGFMEILSNTVV